MIELHLGDCLEILSTMPEMSVDAIVTDPPYGLSFMGKKWDYDVPDEAVWQECLRVLKPGGHLLCFAGTRTQHRMAVRIEDAGFEIRDMIAWVYGCLDEQTEIVTKDGIKPYHKARIGDTVLCYNIESSEYSYQPILEIVEYDYSDTAYRLIGDFGEQVVSRNHRVIIERDGKEIFALAEQVARQQQVRVPILESLPKLRQAISDSQQGASETEQDVQLGLCEGADWQVQCRGDAARSSQGQSDNLRGLRDFDMEAERMASQSAISNVQLEVQRQVARTGLGEPCVQRAFELDASIRGSVQGQDDRRNQPGVEGRFDVSQPQGRILQSGNQVCALPTTLAQYGTQGRLCHGVSPKRGNGAWSDTDALGVRPPHQPRRNGQSVGKPDAVQHERRAQSVRAWRGHTTAVVRVVPFHYTGKVWCLRVPTGAFVAVRNGVAFPTGNSGFPKSLDVSQNIWKLPRHGYTLPYPQIMLPFMNSYHSVSVSYSIYHENRVIQGDCLEVMKDIPDRSIDMVLTSPPYDNLRTYNASLEWGEHIWKPVIRELFRIVKDSGVVVWVVGDATIKGSETGTSFKQALYFKEVGFNLHDTMIYQKTGCAHPDFTRYYQQFEYMFVFTKGVIKTFNQICDRKNKSAGRKGATTERQKDGTTKESWRKKSGAVVKEYGARYNIWQIPNAINNIHPATFPEKLAHDHIVSWSNEGDTILDPFAGSGTVGKMAKQLNRNYILIEKVPEYIDIINKKLNTNIPTDNATVYEQLSLC